MQRATIEQARLVAVVGEAGAGPRLNVSGVTHVFKAMSAYTADIRIVGLPAWGIATWLPKCFEAVSRMRDCQRQRRALLELDDDQLRDIGISRRQALEEGRKPFWR
jgi:uncharacterized protein YjiS (DUF1127 family)